MKTPVAEPTAKTIACFLQYDLSFSNGQGEPVGKMIEPGRVLSFDDERGGKTNGIFASVRFGHGDRSTAGHAEFAALSVLAEKASVAAGGPDRKITGTVNIYIGHTPCLSCSAGFVQFKKKFPDVKLEVDYFDWREYVRAKHWRMCRPCTDQTKK